MDESILAAFRTATQSTFKEMFGVEAVADPPREESSSADHGWDMTGLVGLARQAQGVVAFRLTRAFAASLLATSGVEAKTEGERRELEGGLVGEMTNIIAGKATSAMRGRDIEIAPPVVVRGPNHKIGWPGIAPVVSLGFATPAGRFELVLCVKT